MQLQFIGTGGAFDYECGNSAALLDFRGRRILLDCGHSVYPRLRALDLVQTIEYVLITHLHDDHAGSLSTLLFHLGLLAGRRVPLLCPSPGFEAQLRAFLAIPMQQPERIVDFMPLHALEGIQAIDTFGLHVPQMQTFAYAFEDDDEILLYSGDLATPAPLDAWLGQRKPAKPVRVMLDIAFNPAQTAHTHYRDALDFAARYAVTGYHHDHRQNPADNPIPLAAHTLLR